MSSRIVLNCFPQQRQVQAWSMSGYFHLNRPEPYELEPEVSGLGRKHRLHHAAGHHDLALAQTAAARGELRVEPGDRIEGVAEDVATKTFADRRAVLGGLAEHGLEI